MITLPLGTLEETILVACSATRVARAVTPWIGQGAPDASTLKALSRAVKQGWNSALDTLFGYLSAQQFPGPPAPAPQPARTPVRVGGNIQASKKLIDVKPACPATVNAGIANRRHPARPNRRGRHHQRGHPDSGCDRQRSPADRAVGSRCRASMGVHPHLAQWAAGSGQRDSSDFITQIGDGARRACSGRCASGAGALVSSSESTIIRSRSAVT